MTARQIDDGLAWAGAAGLFLIITGLTIMGLVGSPERPVQRVIASQGPSTPQISKPAVIAPIAQKEQPAPRPPKETVPEILARVAEECGGDPVIMVELAREESKTFDPKARGDRNAEGRPQAFGALQIWPYWHHAMSVDDCYDPARAARYFWEVWVPQWPDVWTAVERWNGSGPRARRYRARIQKRVAQVKEGGK